MRVPTPCSHFEADLAVHLPELRDAQRCGLALWVLGAVLAHSACQSAVLAALELRAMPPGRAVLVKGGFALRCYLTEWPARRRVRSDRGNWPPCPDGIHEMMN